MIDGDSTGDLVRELMHLVSVQFYRDMMLAWERPSYYNEEDTTVCIFMIYLSLTHTIVFWNKMNLDII